MSYGTRVLCNTIRSVLGTAITAAGANYLNVGTPLLYRARMVIFQNETDGDVLISIPSPNVATDVAPNLYLPAGGQMILDFTSNEVKPEGLFLSSGTQVGVTQGTPTAPTTGTFYFSVIYAYGD